MRRVVAGVVVASVAITLCLGLLELALQRNQRVVESFIREIAPVEEPTSAAAYEMEINVIGIGLDVQKYLATGDLQHRERVTKDEADFRHFRTQYERLTTTQEEKALGRELDALYERYRSVGHDLMDLRDRWAALHAEVARNVPRLEAASARGLRAVIDHRPARGSDTLRRAIELEADIGEVASWLGNDASLTPSSPGSSILRSIKSARAQLGALRALGLSSSEREALRTLADTFAPAAARAERLVAMGESLRRGSAEHIRLREGIDELLDDRIQQLALHNLSAASAAASSAISRLNLTSLALVALALCVSALSALAIARRSMQLASANEGLREEIVQRRASDAARALMLERLVSTQEDERRRLARELHDQMGQDLSALMLGLKALSSAPASLAREDAAPMLGRLQDLTGKLIEQAQTIAWNLRPPAFDVVGLEGALSHYVEEWNHRSGVRVDFHCRIGAHRLPDEVEITLYRAAQEGLTNVLKHAQPRNVSLVLERRAVEVVMVVEDDGLGFDPARVPSPEGGNGRLGLVGIRERASMVGGSVEIESAPGSGTTLLVRIPVSAAGAPTVA